MPISNIFWCACPLHCPTDVSCRPLLVFEGMCTSCLLEHYFLLISHTLVPHLQLQCYSNYTPYFTDLHSSVLVYKLKSLLMPKCFFSLSIPFLLLIFPGSQNINYLQNSNLEKKLRNTFVTVCY